MRSLAAPSSFVVCALLMGCADGSPAPSGETAEGALGAADAADPREAERVLYGDEPLPAACSESAGSDRIRCLLKERYASDRAARDTALELFEATGDVAGVGTAQVIDGEYRGNIELVPELPVGTHRKHLTWVREATSDLDAFFANIEREAQAPVRYRWRPINFRFFRSVGRTTPSAYVEGKWELFYNVSGSLLKSRATVRETLVHEMFHMNDFARDSWSRVLAPIVDSIVARCGTNKSCLAPYAPTETAVRGGTYYAFQPNNGPMEVEYSAELASRYFDEQRAAFAGERTGKPAFKCGPPENARAWDLLIHEFFGGVDRVPACAR